MSLPEKTIISHGVTVIIPSYNPDEKLEKVVFGLIKQGFGDIIVVNDGSDGQKTKYFSFISSCPQCTLLEHKVNRGKGRALKTAFEYAIKNRAGITGVVTADGDNQHRPEDILAAAEKLNLNKNVLILGSRDFNSPNVPKKSRKGNKITSFVFRTGCGLKINDTQTGLRAIPFPLLPLFIKIKGERYEYETNMLLELKRYGIEFLEIPIETVYINENETSHFNPFLDSLRIYGLIIKFLLSSASSTLIDMLMFFLLTLTLASAFGKWSVLAFTVISRAVSSAVNFYVNKNVVFGLKKEYGKTILKYYTLAIPQMLMSAGIVYMLSYISDTGGAFLTTLFKAIADTLLFIISFNIQREWVFKAN